MSDQSSSGHRPEPTPGEPAAVSEGSSDLETTVADAAPPPRRGLRRHLGSTRVKLGAAAAVIFLGGGAGGFALAHATSTDEAGMHAPGRDHHGGPDGDGRHPGFGGPNPDA